MSSARCWRLRVTRAFRSIGGKRPRRSLSGSTMISATIAFAQPRGRSRPGQRFSRSTWMRVSRSGPAYLTRAAGAGRGHRRGRRAYARRRSASPRPPLFQFAIERLGCPAGQAAMVGDSTSSDIEGGRAAGMFTIWLDPQDDDIQPRLRRPESQRPTRAASALAAKPNAREASG